MRKVKVNLYKKLKGFLVGYRDRKNRNATKPCGSSTVYVPGDMSLDEWEKGGYSDYLWKNIKK